MANAAEQNRPLILLTGGSGYVGGRLIALLEKQDVKLRCLLEPAKASMTRSTAFEEEMGLLNVGQSKCFVRRLYQKTQGR
jgi:nucleoside-diphosphate-sugar epimerase